MMEFEGIEKVRDQVRQGQTLLNVVQQLTQRLDQLTMALGMTAAVPAAQPNEGQQEQDSRTSGTTMESKAKNAKQATMTAYGQRLAKRSSTNVNQSSNAAMPGGG